MGLPAAVFILVNLCAAAFFDLSFDIQYETENGEMTIPDVPIAAQYPNRDMVHDNNTRAILANNVCSWSINSDVPVTPLNQPLYINPASSDTDVFGFFMPTNLNDDVVTVPKGDSVRFVCPGGHFTHQLLGQDITLQCDSGYRYVDANNNGHMFQDLTCNTLPQDQVQQISQGCGTSDPPSRQLSLNKVGYWVYGGFYSTYEFCFDHTTNDAVYSHFRIDPSIMQNQKNFQTSSFVSDDTFYPNYLSGNELDKRYSKISQTFVFTMILQSKKLAEDVIEPDTNFYLVRGHLAAKAYFVYGAHQASTFWYMNVIPQFASGNSGNWKTLEDQVRKYAYSSGRRLDIYVGSSSILTHLDNASKLKPLYLHFRQNPAESNIKVPEIMWKVVYDRAARQAVAFVLMNTGDMVFSPTVPIMNPFTNYCLEVCPQLPWLKWTDRDFYPLGFSTCCTVSSLKSRITEIPINIDDSMGILT